MANHNSINVLNLNIDQKLDLIDDIIEKNCFTDNELNILNILSYDTDDEVRMLVAESITDSNNALAIAILIRLINDKDCLVRANACDSLCNNKSPVVLAALKNKVLRDRCSLVRGYAALSIADIIINNGFDKQEFIELFFNRLEKEKIIWVKICIYKALYLLGYRKFLDSILIELDNRAYRNRCLVVNVLAEIVSEENIGIIKGALIKRKERENTIAVASTIQNVLFLIQGLI